MPNSIKYSTTGDTLSLRKGNLYFGTGDVGKGPSSVTQHYNGVTPNGGGYTIYFYDPRQPNNIGYDPISSDVQLIRYTNGISGQNFTGVTQCFNWYATQTNYTCVNKDYEGIVTNGLVLNLDAGFLPSYSTSGNTWYDLSYSGNNGTLVNSPTFNSSESGYINFDGVDDSINCGTSQSVLLSAMTLSATFSFTSYTALGTHLLICRLGGGSPYNHNYFFGITESKFYFGFKQSGQNIYPYVWLNNVVPQVNRIYTLTATYSPSTSVSIYLDGVLQSYSGPNTTINPLITNQVVQLDATSICSIGGGFAQNTYFSNAKIYSTQIYNRVLSASEVLQNHNSILSRFNTPNIVKSNLLFNLDASNVVSYPTSGITWLDLSGNGYHSILTNGPTFNSTSKSIVFDGTNDYAQYSARTPNTEFQYYDAFTVEAITYVNESTSNTGLIITNRASRDGNNTEYTGWGLAQYNSSIRGSIGGYPSNVLDWRFVEVTGTTFTNQVFQKWSHIVWVNTGVAGQQKIYINGVDRTNNSGDDATPPYTINYNNGTHRITVGMSPADGTPGGHFLDGSIELTRVYNKALSQSEVLQNFYGGPIVTNGLVMYLDAGNLVSYSGAGTTWYDLTASGNTGTLINGPSYGTTNGPAISFDGTNDYLNTTYNIEAATSSNLQTFCSWMYGTTINSTFFGSGADNTGKFHLILQYSSTTQLFFGESYYGGGAGPTDQNNYATVSPNSTWNYACIVKTAPSTFDVYFNGVKVISGASKAATSSATFSLGRLWSGWYRPSIIGSVQIYNRSLTADEVAQNFNAQKSRFGL